jgi:hypothetical protein
MNTYVYIYMHKVPYARTPRYTGVCYAYMYIPMSTHGCKYICAQGPIYMDTQMHSHIPVNMPACVYICTHIHMPTDEHVNMHANLPGCCLGDSWSQESLSGGGSGTRSFTYPNSKMGSLLLSSASSAPSPWLCLAERDGSFQYWRH